MVKFSLGWLSHLDQVQFSREKPEGIEEHVTPSGLAPEPLFCSVWRPAMTVLFTHPVVLSLHREVW